MRTLTLAVARTNNQAMDFPLPRKMWRTLEPYHAAVYFLDEPREEYADLGIDDVEMSYFASRAAPMGAVTADVVIATFYNFHPDMVRRSIPEAWRRAAPERILEARLRGVDRSLHRVLGDAAASPEMAEAAELARDAAGACTPEGRALYAGHASLPWPDAPHLVLWHAATLLREFRGDGHIAALVTAGIGPCEALILHEAGGEIPPGFSMRITRQVPDAEWEAAVDRLRERGLLDASGALTDRGRVHREEVEARTDELAAPPWDRIGRERADRLRALVRPFSSALVEAGTFTRSAFSTS